MLLGISCPKKFFQHVIQFCNLPHEIGLIHLQGEAANTMNRKFVSLVWKYGSQLCVVGALPSTFHFAQKATDLALGVAVLLFEQQLYLPL